MILDASATDIAAATDAEIAAVSVRGVAHVKAKTPNQDAAETRRDGEWSMMAVADGHGAARHYRSDRGARFAVAETLDLLGHLARAGEDTIAASVPHLAEDLVAAWRRRVEEDVRSDPVRERPGFESHVVYGSTCLGAVIGPGLSLFLQIGDGDVMASAPRERIGWAIPRDPALTGHGTYSLCQQDAVARMHVRLFRDPHPLSAPDFALLATDGLARSYPVETRLAETVDHMRDSLRRTDLASFARALEPWLFRCSEMGSRDDVSVALFSALPKAAAV